MTEKEIKQLLNSSGIPFRYHHWKTRKRPPFGVYLFPESKNLMADGGVYYKSNTLQVELYTEEKEPETEEALEKVLDQAGFFYEKTEDYLQTEDIYQVTYEMEM